MNKRRVRSNWPLLVFFLLYAPAVIYYYGWIAKDRYVSRSHFVVTRGIESQSLGTFEGMLGGGQSQQDAYTAITYMKSIDVLRHLGVSGFDLRAHYSKADNDWLIKLSPTASEQDLYEYFSDRVKAQFDDVEGIIELEIQAFEPEFAMNIADALLVRTGEYLNETNRTIAEERMKYILDELADSETRLEAARQELIAFQNKNLVIDPQEDTQARLKLINELRTEKVMLQAELTGMRARSPQSPAIPALQSGIDALEQEIVRESKTLTGEGPDQMNQLNAEFTRLTQALEFASQRYQQSLAVAEEIRVQTIQAHRFLSIIERPFLPDAAEFPKRLYMSCAMIVLGFLGIQLIGLIFKTVSEHRS